MYDELFDVLFEEYLNDTDILNEYTITLEAAAEDNAMKVRDAMRWYSKFVTKSKNTRGENKKEIEEKIKMLETCVKDMKRAKHSVNDKQIYILKNAIPFNGIYRFIKHRDNYAGIASMGEWVTILGLVIGGAPAAVAGGAAGFTSGMIRSATFEKMLDAKIKETNEAIDFLKGKLKEMK